MRTLLSIGEAAALLDVCVGTMRNWEARNRLRPCSRTLGGHRRYDVNDLPTNGAAEQRTTGKTVAYARVSPTLVLVSISQNEA